MHLGGPTFIRKEAGLKWLPQLHNLFFFFSFFSKRLRNSENYFNVFGHVGGEQPNQVVLSPWAALLVFSAALQLRNLFSSLPSLGLQTLW